MVGRFLSAPFFFVSCSLFVAANVVSNTAASTELLARSRAKLPTHSHSISQFAGRLSARFPERLYLRLRVYNDQLKSIREGFGLGARVKGGTDSEGISPSRLTSAVRFHSIDARRAPFALPILFRPFHRPAELYVVKRNFRQENPEREGRRDRKGRTRLEREWKQRNFIHDFPRVPQVKHFGRCALVRWRARDQWSAARGISLTKLPNHACIMRFADQKNTTRMV